MNCEHNRYFRLDNKKKIVLWSPPNATIYKGNAFKVEQVAKPSVSEAQKMSPSWALHMHFKLYFCKQFLVTFNARQVVLRKLLTKKYRLFLVTTRLCLVITGTIYKAKVLAKLALLLRCLTTR